MKTYSQKKTDVERKWYVLDAAGTSFGRIATQAASLLIGKGKPTFTPHTDGGDFVIIVNAGQMKITGGKEDKKMYHYHSGYPGGLTTKTMSDVGNVTALEEAVRGMLPVNKLRDGRLARLKIYEDAQHNHAAQKPVELSLKGSK